MQFNTITRQHPTTIFSVLLGTQIWLSGTDQNPPLKEMTASVTEHPEKTKSNTAARTICRILKTTSFILCHGTTLEGAKRFQCNSLTCRAQTNRLWSVRLILIQGMTAHLKWKLPSLLTSYYQFNTSSGTNREADNLTDTHCYTLTKHLFQGKNHTVLTFINIQIHILICTIAEYTQCGVQCRACWWLRNWSRWPTLCHHIMATNCGQWAGSEPMTLQKWCAWTAITVVITALVTPHCEIDVDSINFVWSTWPPLMASGTFGICEDNHWSQQGSPADTRSTAQSPRPAQCA